MKMFGKTLGVLLLCFIVGMVTSQGFVVFADKFSLGQIVGVDNTLDIGLVVRDAPAGNSIGKKYDNDLGMIIGGPQSAYYAGVLYTWWKIRWADEDGLEGWSAEGYPGGVDYLVHVIGAPSHKFHIEDFVEVYSTGEMGLKVRSDPPELARIGVVYDGTAGRVIGGPFYGVPKYDPDYYYEPGLYYFWEVDYGGIVGWSAEDWLRKVVAVSEPIITSGLSILQSPPYYVGDTITATFTITNKATTPFTFDVLTVGGRDPDGQVADFTWVRGITLNSEQSYNYQGILTLKKAGNYHFFCAYRTPDAVWNTAIPTESGVSNILDIYVDVTPTPGRLIIVPDHYATIQTAVDVANPGDTIIVRDGTYTENVKIYKNRLAVKSESGTEATTVQAKNPNDDIFLVTANYVNINGFTIRGANGSGTYAGIKLYVANFCNISSNIIHTCKEGIVVYFASNNIVSNNIIYGDNVIRWNSPQHGIFLGRANFNVVTNNSVRLPLVGGISIWEFSSKNVVSNNIIDSSLHFGIYIVQDSSENIIKNNKITNCDEYGLYVAWSNNNFIYLNDLVNDRNYYSEDSTNSWHSQVLMTYIYGWKTFVNYLGNYWSDYIGSDADEDGVGDTPYIIDSDMDTYPLTEPFENYFTSVYPPENLPPTCAIKLQKAGVEINEINVGEFFDIYVGGSTDDTGIVHVRFSSDDVQDGIPTGEWTKWYNWSVSEGDDWNAVTKIKRWAFATPWHKEVWAEVQDDIGQTNKSYAFIYAYLPENVIAVITSPLMILSSSPYYPYHVGDSLMATFSITNKIGVSITFDTLVVGGRGPDGEVVDFDKAYHITLSPSGTPDDTYNYQGYLTLPNKPGIYHFFCAYYIENPTEEEKKSLDENNWNTNIAVELDGRLLSDFEAMRYRERIISVCEKAEFITNPPRLWEEIHGPWEKDLGNLKYFILQVVTDPTDPETIYVLVRYLKPSMFNAFYYDPVRDEIFRLSREEWEKLGEGLPSLGINVISISPTNHNIMYAGTEQGVFKSVNGGATWYSLNGPNIGWWIFKHPAPIISLAVDAYDPNTVYAGTKGDGFWKKEGGQDWKKIGPSYSIAHILRTSPPQAAGIIYASGCSVNEIGFVSSGGILKSEDKGSSWMSKWTKGIVTDIACWGISKEIVYVSTSSFPTKIPFGVPGFTDVTFITVPVFADTIIRYDGIGEWSNENFWHEAVGKGGKNPLPDGMYSSLALHPEFPNMVFTVVLGKGVYYSINYGNDWFPLGLEGLVGTNDKSDVTSIVLSSNTNSQILYAYGATCLFKLRFSNAAIILREYSAGKLRVYDSMGRVTGLVNGEIKDEIPNSLYDNNSKTIIIFSPSDSYRYVVEGVQEELYSLTIINVTGHEFISFSSINIPTSTNMIHEYAVNWDALSLGETGVTVMVDSDGDGVFEHTFTSDSELTQSEYVIATDDIPPQTWINIGEPKFVVNGLTYLTSATPMELVAEDNLGGSGVALTAYRIYNASYDSGWITYTEPFYLTGLSDGIYQIDYNSTDYAGNVESTNTVTVSLDNTPPTTSLIIGEPKYVSNTTYVTPDTPFTLEANDNAGSGVYSIDYRIYNGTYDSGWQPYAQPFYLTGLADGVYTIEFNSTDNLGNAEATKSIQVTLFSWNYIFTDSYGRGTTLKINTEHKFFQFITPDKDYGIRKATYMYVYKRTIIICHKDNELRLATVSVDTQLDFCIAYAKDTQTGKEYWLIDKVGTEN